MNNQHIKDYGLAHQKLDKSITDLARETKEYFDSDLSVEQIRKILSRELNKPTQIYVNKSSRKYEPITLTKKEEHDLAVSSAFKKKERQDTFTTPGTYLVLGCAHVPGHNVPMINGITNLLTDIKVEGLMLIGDFLDLNSLSGHDRGKFTAIKDLTLDEEYVKGNLILNQLTKPLSKTTEKVYIFGNHENRWQRHMADMQNAKTPLLSPTEALNLHGRGFNVFENWTSDFVKLGNHLELVHGQYYNTHCAKQHIDKFRGSVMFAHTHRIQMYVEGKTGGFNIGWGGDVNHPFFNYAERGTKGQWQNGFALVQIDEQGDYFTQQIFVHNNKFYYNGKVYN